MKIAAVDLFCGVGGLTHGLKLSGIDVLAGYDIDEASKYAYEYNNNACFINKDIQELQGQEIRSILDGSDVKILTGCAPCQPFSSYSNAHKKKKSFDSKWNLLNSFSRVINESNVDIISMENVPELVKETIFADFINNLLERNYSVTWEIVNCPDYEIPQNRKRLVLLASKLGEIKLIDPILKPENYLTVKDAIGKLPKISSGEYNVKDRLHYSSKLSEKNIKRIKQSIPGGNWKDWDEDLRLECHRKKSGNTYKSVYGRMEWNKPSPTITTQFNGYGNGRFGHPEQDRALSFREGALLQTFPIDYKFFEENKDLPIKKLGIQIGNAVPVLLGKAIGDSIMMHLKKHKSD